MKTTLLLVTAFLFTTTTLNAQVSLGVKGGANISKIDGKSFSDEFRYGYHLGGFVEIPVGSKFSIQPEVLFNQYQTQADTSFSSVYQGAVNFNNYKNIQLNYLTVPILLNYKLGKALSLQAGPQVGILLAQDKNILENGREAFKNGEFSVLGGLQFSLGALRLNGRYFVGLNNISDIDNQNEWKNQGFQISAGLAF